MVRQIVIEPTQQTAAIALAVAGRERAAYRSDLTQRRILVCVVNDTSGQPDKVILAVAGSPSKGAVSYAPRQLRGDGPLIVRLDSFSRVPQLDRLAIKGFVDALLLQLQQEGGAT